MISIEGPGMSEGLARPDALLRLVQAQGAAPPPDAYQPAAHWVSYGAAEAIPLAIVLLVVAGGFGYAGKRLRAPLRVTRPGNTAAAFMIAIWLLAIYTAYVAWLVYGLQVKQAYPGFVASRVRVGTPVYAPMTFFVILYLTRRWGWKIAPASAVIGTVAALMIFEFPFDLIILARTNPPIPTHPMLYRQLLFLPFFLVQFSTVSLLTLLPSMRVTGYASYAVAGMFLVFAVWAAFGFAFPAEPLPLALNIISKILCFLAAIMLFVWREDGEASKVRKWRVSSVVMGPAEGLLTGPTADTQARRWELVQVPLRDLGSGLLGVGAPQNGPPDAGLSIRGQARSAPNPMNG